MSANSGPDKSREYRVRWKREGDKSWRTKIYQTKKGALNWAYTVIGYKWDYAEQRYLVEDDPVMTTHYAKLAPVIGIRVESREVSDWNVVEHLPFLHIDNQRELAAKAPTPDELKAREYAEIQSDIRAEVEATWL